MEITLKSITRKRKILEYLNEIINAEQEKVETTKGLKKRALIGGVLRSILFGGVLLGSAVIMLTTAQTPFYTILTIALTPISVPTLLGLPLSVYMSIEEQLELRKIIANSKKVLDVAIIREEYERQVLEELLNDCDDSRAEKDFYTLDYEEKMVVNRELETCAFNMHKLTKARKYGNLNKFLLDHFSITRNEAIEMYEALIDRINEPKSKKRILLTNTQKSA